MESTLRLVFETETKRSFELTITEPKTLSDEQIIQYMDELVALNLFVINGEPIVARKNAYYMTKRSIIM